MKTQRPARRLLRIGIDATAPSGPRPNPSRARARRRRTLRPAFSGWIA